MTMGMFYVYFLRRPDQDDPFEPGQACPFYVGKGSNGRVGEHRKEAKWLYGKPNRKPIKIVIIHKLWKQDLNFEVDIIFDGLTEQEAFEYEREAIATYGRIDLGTGCLANLTDGGEGALHSEETKQRIGKALMGNTNSRGVCPTEATRNKISKSLLGRQFSKEHRKKLKEAGQRRILSEEIKQKISKTLTGKYVGEDSPRYGKTHTQAVREAVCEANRRREHSTEEKQKRSNSIKQYWGSISEEQRQQRVEKMKQRRWGVHNET